MLFVDSHIVLVDNISNKVQSMNTAKNEWATPDANGF